MFRLLVLLGCCSIAMSAYCGTPSISPDKYYFPGQRNIGNQQLDQRSWPWLASVVQVKPGKPPLRLCDGVLVSPTSIYTSRSCASPLVGEDYLDFLLSLRIVIGEQNLTKALASPAGKVFSPVYFSGHSGFNSPPTTSHVPLPTIADHDYFTIRIQEPGVAFTADVQPACYPQAPIYQSEKTFISPVTKRRICFVAGRGTAFREEPVMENPATSAQTDNIWLGVIEIYSSADCKAKMRGSFFDTNSMICGVFSNEWQDNYQGSSGGPLVCKNSNGFWEVHGVVTCGASCTEKGKPIIYASIFNFLQYDIKNLLSELSCGNPSIPVDKEALPHKSDVKLLQKSWPWIATIFRKPIGTEPTRYCDGTLISRSYVLTAAYCFDHLTDAEILKEMNVLIGEHSLDKVGTEFAKIYNIKRIIKHPKYNNPSGSFNNDLALVKLTEDVVFSSNSRPACLPNRPLYQSVSTLINPLTRRRVCYVAGRKSGRMGFSDDLFLTRTEIPDRTSCKDTIKAYFSDQNTMVCGVLQDKSRMDYKGDGGAALICKNVDNFWEVQGVDGGVVVNGVDSLFANVSYYLPWINDNMKPMPNLQA